MQIRLCMTRGVQRLLGDKTFFIVTVGGNLVMSLVLGSVYFDLAVAAETMNSRCSVLFFAILFNGLSSVLEVCDQLLRWIQAYTLRYWHCTHNDQS